MAHHAGQAIEDQREAGVEALNKFEAANEPLGGDLLAGELGGAFGGRWESEGVGHALQRLARGEGEGVAREELGEVLTSSFDDLLLEGEGDGAARAITREIPDRI